MNIVSKEHSFTDDTKVRIKDLLCSFYGATDVTYENVSYGLKINVSGSCNFRFVKSAIQKQVNLDEFALQTLSESNEKSIACYVYMPENDKNLKKTKKTK